MGNLRQTLLLVSCLLVPASQLVPPAHAQSTDAVTHANDDHASMTLSGAQRSREGYFHLQVEGLNDDQQFVIEQSSSAEFDDVTATFPPLGSFRQISLSGFDDGTYYFRARVEQSDGSASYSNTHQLTVQHYPLWQALSLFAVGGLLFITLLVTMLRLHWCSQRTQVSTKRPSSSAREDSHG